ncbi:MAG: protein-L-isoaspartate(D-aspartate) O-methyltransferase [Gammaproteobacteria bacterium]|nr:protein-L-isoaspartate(D-aspartate) O-methyltransferase [Gammaproteobacteria bacterium]
MTPNSQTAFSRADREGVGFTSQRARDQLCEQLRDSGIRSEQVLQVIASTPRHLFVDQALWPHAYQNRTLPIGHGQTISQPWVVARMTELLLAKKKPQKVLEVGTGCGYQTAVLSALVPELHSAERIAELQERAKSVLNRLGIAHPQFSLSDGCWGLDVQAPFDGILVTAAPVEVPEALLDQLAVGGRLVIPAGPDGRQRLQVFDRVAENDFEQQYLDDVAFVPLKSGVIAG